MPASFQIASIRGIPIKVHVTLLLMLPLLGALFAANLRAAADAAEVSPERLAGPAWLWGLGIALGLFLAVLLHELAHTFYALRTGGRVQGITLLMLGGVSELSEAPERPRHEALMALVGPLTSLALGALLFAVGGLMRETASFNLHFAVMTLATLNVTVGLFNVLPAFPMDGGRILRAVLVPRQGYLRATRSASRIGKGFAVLFGLLGLLSFNVLLVFIASFVYLGAEAEWRQVQMKEGLGRLHVRDLMNPTTETLHADRTFEAASALMRERRLLALPVEREGRVVGVLSAEALRRVPPELRPTARAEEYAERPVAISPEEPAWRAVQLLATHRVSQLVVLEAGRLVGTVDRTDVQRALVLHGEAGREERRRPLRPRERH